MLGFVRDRSHRRLRQSETQRGVWGGVHLSRAVADLARGRLDWAAYQGDASDDAPLLLVDVGSQVAKPAHAIVSHSRAARPRGAHWSPRERSPRGANPCTRRATKSSAPGPSVGPFVENGWTSQKLRSRAAESVAAGLAIGMGALAARLDLGAQAVECPHLCRGPTRELAGLAHTKTPRRITPPFCCSRTSRG